jgi:peptidoglycan/xylan/chitin deacetylase (PgdA/CDA1 family)
VVLTFDDGYLDNWVFAYPVLKKYGLKATIFINPEFVNPSCKKRKNLEDCNYDAAKLKTGEKLGFLNWPEIAELEKSGVMDIQSHSMSHNWYFKSNQIIDLYTGQNDYDWLAWISRPDRKPFYMTEDQKGFTPCGYPVFENDRALSLQRYFPDERLIETARSLFAEYSINGRLSDENRQKIIYQLNSLLKNKYPGSFETDEEMEKRYRYELLESKRIIEEKLDKKVNFLCWPGGGYNDLAIEISKQGGYKGSTLSSKNKKHIIVNDGDYKRVPRMGMGSFVYKGERKIPAKLKNHLIYSFHAKRGKLLPKFILKLQQYLI